MLRASTSSRLDAQVAVPALNAAYPGVEEAGWFAATEPAAEESVH